MILWLQTRHRFADYTDAAHAGVAHQSAWVFLPGEKKMFKYELQRIRSVGQTYRYLSRVFFFSFSWCLPYVGVCIWKLQHYCIRRDQSVALSRNRDRSGGESRWKFAVWLRAGNLLYTCISISRYVKLTAIPIKRPAILQNIKQVRTPFWALNNGGGKES